MPAVRQSKGSGGPHLPSGGRPCFPCPWLYGAARWLRAALRHQRGVLGTGGEIHPESRRAGGRPAPIATPTRSIAHRRAACRWFLSPRRSARPEEIGRRAGPLESPEGKRELQRGEHLRRGMSASFRQDDDQDEIDRQATRRASRGRTPLRVIELRRLRIDSSSRTSLPSRTRRALEAWREVNPCFRSRI